jgi:hypothetical protein
MKNITIKAKWVEILSAHSVSLRGEVYNAVIQYLTTDTIPDMSEAAEVAFSFIRYEIDARKKTRKAACPDQPSDSSDQSDTSDVSKGGQESQESQDSTPSADAPAPRKELYSPELRSAIAGIITSLSRARTAGVPEQCKVVTSRNRAYIGEPSPQ